MNKPLKATLTLLLASLSFPLAIGQSSKDQFSSYPPDLSETYRPALLQDLYPGGEPAVIIPLSEEPSVTFPFISDVVISNTNTNLKNTNTTPNGEPSIAINPGNTNEIAILAFSGNWGANAPIWYSTNGGGLWSLDRTIPNPPGLPQNCPCDQTLDWGNNGRLSATFLHKDSFGIDAYSSTTSDPSTSADWKWYVTSGVTQTTDLAGIGHTDQPWLLMARDPINSTQYNVYVAYDDRAPSPIQVRVAVAPGSDPPNFTRDKLVGYSSGPINQGLRIAKDIHRNHAIYALWQVCPSSAPNCKTGTDPKTVDYYLNCSSDGGKTWSLNGKSTGWFMAQTLSNQPWPKFGTVNAILGGIDHVAVDPNNGDVYVVVGDLDPSTGIDRLLLIHEALEGPCSLKFVNTSWVTGQAETALPSIAIAQNTAGTIGVLYTNYDGIDSTTGLPIFSVFLAISNDHGQSFQYNRLEKFLSTTTDNGNARQRVLGDYQQVKAWGNTFYGVFAGNGVPFGRPFANIDPIFFKMTVP